MLSVIAVVIAGVGALVWLSIASAKDQAKRRDLDKKLNEAVDLVCETVRNAKSLQDFENALAELDRAVEGMKVFYFRDTARRYQVIRAWLQGAIEGWKRRDL